MKYFFYFVISYIITLPTYLTAQNIEWHVKQGSSTSSFYLYDTFNGTFEFINTRNSDICIHTNPFVILTYFQNSKGEWRPLYPEQEPYIPNELAWKKYDTLSAGESFINDYHLSLWHPHFNDALFTEFWNKKTVPVRFRGQFLNPKTSLDTFIYSQPFNLNIKPLEVIDQSYLNWLNDNKILYNQFPLTAISMYYTTWDRADNIDPRLFHNITLSEIDSSMTLFPNCLMLGLCLTKILDGGLDKTAIPKDLAIRMFVYVGHLQNKALCETLKWRVEAICNYPDVRKLPGAPCEAYKTLAPLYGLPN